MTLKTHRLRTVAQVRAFLDGTAELDVQVVERAAAYDFLTSTLSRLGYSRLSRADKGVVRQFLAKVTGLSRAQTTRLIAQYRATGRVRDRRGPPARPFTRRYTSEDIRLLAEVDALHGTLSGLATRKLCERAFEVLATLVSSAWRRFPTGTCTTFATQPLTSAAAARWTRPERCTSASANGAGLTPRGAPDSSGWTPFIRATSTASRACTT